MFKGFVACFGGDNPAQFILEIALKRSNPLDPAWWGRAENAKGIQRLRLPVVTKGARRNTFRWDDERLMMINQQTKLLPDPLRLRQIILIVGPQSFFWEISR